MALAVAVALALSGCSFSFGNRYAEAEDLAKAIGIASMTKVVATDTFGTGGFSCAQPTYQVLVTGDIAAERRHVEAELSAKGFVERDEIWLGGDDRDVRTVAVVAEPAGFRFTDSSGRTTALTASGMLYVIHASGE